MLIHAMGLLGTQRMNDTHFFSLAAVINVEKQAKSKNDQMVKAGFKRERKSTQVSLLVVTCVCTIQTNRKHAQVYCKSPQLAKKFERFQSYRKSPQVGSQTCADRLAFSFDRGFRFSMLPK
jgi:hypothetical protein